MRGKEEKERTRGGNRRRGRREERGQEGQEGEEMKERKERKEGKIRHKRTRTNAVA